MAIKAIIFDWHGVLDLGKFDALVKKLSELSGLSAENVVYKIRDIKNIFILGGEPSVYWGHTATALGLTTGQIESARKSVMKIVPNQSLWSKLPALKQNYRLAILSDCPLDKASEIRSSCDLRIFDGLHFSGEKGLAKSQDEFFLNLVSELGVPAQECLYVDDREKHIETAAKLGLQTCHFTETADLENTLTRIEEND